MTSLAAADLAQVEAALLQACGLSLSPALRSGLEAAVGRAAEAMGLQLDDFLRSLLAGDPECVTRMVELSVVGETYFFRHPEQWSALGEKLRSELAGQEAITLWSAGCSSGEEPYTAAMVLLQAGRLKKADRILATDLSELALARARTAAYGKWSLRRMDPGAQLLFFDPLGDLLQVKDELRKKVELRRHNLIRDPAPVSGCQIILCRNVLIYFAPQAAARVLRMLADALAPGGYLVLGPVELSLAAALPLEWVELCGATLLRRPAQAARETGIGAGEAPTHPLPAHEDAPSPGREAMRQPLAAAPVEQARLPTRFELAREAARAGRLDEAGRLAREEGSSVSFLLLSMVAESRGELQAAVDLARKALYLEPSLATAHAFLIPLHLRLGRPDASEHARRNALAALAGVDDSCVLRGVEAITAGALRRALDPQAATCGDEARRQAERRQAAEHEG